MSFLTKPTEAERKLRKKTGRLKLEADERGAKLEVRRRDRGCRFPLCGCVKLGLAMKAWQEVSHDKHKGMGGNRAGDRSVAALMVQLCKHRHQAGRISRHAGTLRHRFLTRDGWDGAVEWLVDLSALQRGTAPRWVVLATELTPGTLAGLTDWQQRTLEKLATMEM